MAEDALSWTVTAYSICRYCQQPIGWHAESDCWRDPGAVGRTGRGSAQCPLRRRADGEIGFLYHIPVDTPESLDRETVEAWLDEPV